MSTLTKICPRCRQEFLLTPEFWHKDSHTKSGYRAYCKQCHKLMVKIWQKENPAKEKERVQRWHWANSEKVKERRREYYQG